MDDKSRAEVDEKLINWRDNHLYRWLSLLFLLPTIGYLQLYVGLLTGSVLLLVGLVGIWFVGRYRLLNFDRYLTDTNLSMIFVGIMILFLIFYPQLDGGSDRDDAINIGTRYLLNGRFPYEGRTQLGNPFSNLPGSFILALPFVLLGSSAYQNIFWLIAVYLIVGSLGYAKRNLLLLLIFFVSFSLPFWHELLTGGDLLASNIFLGSFLLLYVGARGKGKIGWGILFGFALATRPHFWLLIPLLFGFVREKKDWKTAVGEAFFPFIVSFVLSAIFYLWSPEQFSPIQNASGEIAQFNQIVPYTELMIYGGMILLSLWGSWKQDGRIETVFFFYGCVQLFPLALISLLGTGYNLQLDLRYLGLFSLNYIIPFLFFLMAEGGATASRE